jgi:hypothetical protein
VCTINEFISVYWNGSASVRAFGQLFSSGHGIRGSAATAAPGWCVLSDVFLSCFAISLGSYDTAAHGQGENTGEREGPSIVLSLSTLYA